MSIGVKNATTAFVSAQQPWEVGMKWIDLRSDTVTLPTPEMRRAMAEAELGDDVYGEDPTVNRLEAMSAERLGTQAAVFVPSGTMGNLAAILAHCDRGDEVIIGDRSHTLLFEVGGVAALGGIHPRTIPNQPDGTLSLEDLRDAVRPDDIHQPVTRLVCIENTHNRCGGVALTAEYTQQVAELAREFGLKMHLDGARIFDAAVALGVEASDLARPVDSVTFCLSKSLCAPVGSVICGSEEFIQRARRMRKQLGGGMRQAGVIAAAGVVALENMVDRLAEDHQKAAKLARSLSDLPGIFVEELEHRTNMVFIQMTEDCPLDARALKKALGQEGVRVGATADRRIRMVLHYWIDDDDVKTVAQAYDRVLNA
jgi:threonine aldolase